MTNPTPVAWMCKKGLPIIQATLLAEQNQEHWTRLFTEDQLQQAKADALREAAEALAVYADSQSEKLFPKMVADMAAELEGEGK